MAYPVDPLATMRWNSSSGTLVLEQLLLNRDTMQNEWFRVLTYPDEFGGVEVEKASNDSIRKLDLYELRRRKDTVSGTD